MAKQTSSCPSATPAQDELPHSFLNGASPIDPRLDADYKAWKAAERHLIATLVEVQSSCAHPQVLHEIDGWAEHRRTCVICGLTEKGSIYSRLGSWSRADHFHRPALRDAPGRLIIGVTGAQAATSRLSFPNLPEKAETDQKPGESSSSTVKPG